MSVGTLWDRIEAWLKTHAKDLRKSLRRPAKPEEVVNLQTALGVSLPADFAGSIARHDGQSDEAESGLFPHSGMLGPEPAWRLLSIAEIKSFWKQIKELVDGGEFDDQRSAPASGVRSDWWCPGWVPVADNGGGDAVCLDMAPDDGGAVGRVILFSHDAAERPILAPSFEAWLIQLADNMESGRYVYDPDEGLIELEDDDDAAEE